MIWSLVNIWLARWKSLEWHAESQNRTVMLGPRLDQMFREPAAFWQAADLASSQILASQHSVAEQHGCRDRKDLGILSTLQAPAIFLDVLSWSFKDNMRMQLPEATQSAYDKNSRRLHMTLTGRTLNGIIRKNSCMWVSAGNFSQEIKHEQLICHTMSAKSQE